MFDTSYPVRYIHHTTLPGSPYTDHLLTFTCRFNHQYLIHVEEYAHLVFGVKFHLKAHQDSDRKYSLMTKFNDTPRVLATIVQAMKLFEVKHPLATFAFFGAEQEGEPVANTKRFRVYKPIMENFFNEAKFDRQYLEAESFYLILNKEHDQQNPALYTYTLDQFKVIIGKQEE